MLRLSAICLLCLLAVATPAPADDAPVGATDIVSMLRQAQQALDAKEHVRAAELLERAYSEAKEPETQWLYLAAASWHRAGRMDDAARALRALEDSGAAFEPPWLELAAFTALERGKAGEAARTAGLLASLEPGRVDHWRLLAKARMEDGGTAGAASALEAAVRLGRASRSDMHALAGLYLASGALDLGAAMLERAIGSAPTADDCDRLAMIHARADDLDAALAWMAKAQALAPTAGRMLDRGDLLRDAGRDAEAAEAYAGAARLDSGLGQAWLRLGYAAYDSGQFQRARDAFARAARLPATRDTASGALAALETMLSEEATGDGS